MSYSIQAVAERWATQIPNRRGGMHWGNRRSTASFQDDLYSWYSVPVARLLKKQKVALINQHGPTRYAALMHAKRAGYQPILVPNVRTEDHAANLQAMIDEYRELVKRYINWRVDLEIGQWRLGRLDERMKSMTLYRKALKLGRIKLPDLDKDLERIGASRKRKLLRYHSPKAIADREYRKAKQNLRELVFGDDA